MGNWIYFPSPVTSTTVEYGHSSRLEWALHLGAFQQSKAATIDIMPLSMSVARVSAHISKHPHFICHMRSSKHMRLWHSIHTTQEKPRNMMQVGCGKTATPVTGTMFYISTACKQANPTISTSAFLRQLHMYTST